MKKLPVCKTCVSGSLCFSCQEKFDKKYITQFDLDLASDFLELEKEKFPQLRTASFYNAIDVGDVVFLVIGNGDQNKYSKELLEYIKNLYDIPEIILITKGNSKEMIEQIVVPAKFIGINQIYIPTGEIEFKIVISIDDTSKLKVPIELIEKAARILLRGICKLEILK